jgi:hypothetical protein
MSVILLSVVILNVSMLSAMAPPAYLGHFYATKKKSFTRFTPGPTVIKLFTAVIYCHSMVISPFCVIKQHYLGNYCGMVVNYNGIYITNVIKHNLT